jgi:hypothetical protein
MGKHGVDFEEAATVFRDPSCWFGPMWSILKTRNVGSPSASRFGNCSWWWCTQRMTGPFESSVLARQSPKKGGSMSNPKPMESDENMRAEYDFSNAVRGKYTDRFSQDVVMVTLEPDVAAAFPDAESVNEALRVLLKAAKKMAPAA